MIELVWLALLIPAGLASAIHLYRHRKDQPPMIQPSKPEPDRRVHPIAAITARPPWLIRRHVPRDDHGRYDLECGERVLAGLADPQLVTAAEASRLTGVPVGTIYSWAARGRLPSFDRDREGRPLYDLADVNVLGPSP